MLTVTHALIISDNGKGRQLLNWVKKQFGAMHPTPVSEPTLSQNEERIGDLVIFRNYHIGSGAFGYVFRGKFGPTPCAIKVLNPLGMEFVASLPVGSNALQNSAQQKALDHFNKECKFLEQIKHKNIVQYMTTLLHPKSGFPVLVLELLDCTLRQYISNDISNDMLPDPVQLSLCYDIALALELLHEKDIVHRDLCGDNVLLKLKQPSGIPVAKVSDFGMSRIIDCDTLSEKLTILGHRKGYMPIEAYSSCYNSSLDIFMFGVVMTQIALKIPNVKTKLERKQFIDKISATHPLKNIILNCTKENADERLHANQICKELKKYLPKHS